MVTVFTNLILHKVFILPELLNFTESWTLLSTHAAAMRVFERKVLRKIFGPVRVADKRIEPWTLLSTDSAALRVFERKVLRKIFSPVQVDDDFGNRSNRKLYELVKDMDVAAY